MRKRSNGKRSNGRGVVVSASPIGTWTYGGHRAAPRCTPPFRMQTWRVKELQSADGKSHTKEYQSLRRLSPIPLQSPKIPNLLFAERNPTPQVLQRDEPRALFMFPSHHDWKYRNELGDGLPDFVVNPGRIVRAFCIHQQKETRSLNRIADFLLYVLTGSYVSFAVVFVFRLVQPRMKTARLKPFKERPVSFLPSLILYETNTT